MSTRTLKQALAIGVAGAIAVGAASPSWAAPVSSNTVAVKQAATGDVIDVRHRGRWVGGLALGIIGTAALAAAADRYYYYDDYPPRYYRYRYSYDPYWGERCYRRWNGWHCW